MFRFTLSLPFIGILAAASCEAALAQTIDDPKPKSTANRVDALLEAIAVGKDLPSDAKERLPDLIGLVENGEDSDAELAMRVLAKLGSGASPAIATISKKLSDPTSALREAAADALVAIGDPSVAPVRALLNAPTARTRASAVNVLSRLKRLNANDLAGPAKDPDPRVRGAAANALSALGKPGVPLLAALLQDPDLAVAAEAARGLRANRTDATTAVPSLIKALPREELGAVAAEALSAYGIGARKAIPAIIKAFPLGQDGSFFHDAGEAALEHIGPPDISDIPELCDNLRRDEEVRILVAKCLGWLGLDGRSAADALEAAAESSFKDYRRRSSDAKAQEQGTDNTGRLFVAGEDCVVAVWDVTHDSARFLRLVERLAIAADSPIFGYYSHRKVLTDLTAEDVRLLAGMLRHSNINVQQTALAVLSDVGKKAVPLKGAVLDLAQGQNAELSRVAIHTLAAMGAKAGNDVVPVVASKLQDGTLPLPEFANVVGELEIRTPAAQAALESGLSDKDRWAVICCAKAMCITAKAPRRVARLVTDAAGAGPFTERDAIECLSRLQGADDVVISFLMQQIDSEDYWTRHDAIDALGAFGLKAAPALTALKKQLADKTVVIRLTSAASIFLITNDAAELDKQLATVFATDDPSDRHTALRTIAKLKRFGSKFVRFPVAELRRSPPVFAEEAIEALQAIGTEEAVAALRTTAESSDWVLRSHATKALRQLEKPDGKGEK
jgi:HEAT repeat protein